MDTKPPKTKPPKTKALNIIFAAIFMAALIAPMAFADPRGGEVSEQEKRVLAERPPMQGLLEGPQGFIRQFDAWFTDNTGFRANMLGLFRQLDRLETQGQYADGDYIYLIGQEGHRYFAGYEGFLIYKFQGVAILGDYRLQEFTEHLDEIGLFLEENGTPFVTMFCTDKETVYPEYYPKSIKRGPDPFQIDVVTGYILENLDIDLFNTRECLVAEKENYLVYNKASGDVGHWNEIGAFFVYRELMKHIGAYLPGTEPMTEDDIDIAYGEDGNPVVTLRQAGGFRQLGPEFFDGATLERPFTWQNIAFENDDPELPTIMIMCDSFGETLCKYVPRHFGKTILIHYTNMEYFKENYELYQPDIVVLEVAERQLTWAPGYINLFSAG